MMAFAKDRAIGQIGEDAAISVFNKLGIHVDKNTNKNRLSHYDLICTAPYLYTTTFMVEVKNDVYSVISGNIAIEIGRAYGNQKSGLTITKANLWMHIVGQDIYITSISKLQQYIKQNKPKRIIESAGDGNAQIMLFEISKIIPSIFTAINGTDIEKEQQLIKSLLDN
jgi:Holliday junction resolvase-like predicted endonuclease